MSLLGDNFLVSFDGGFAFLGVSGEVDKSNRILALIREIETKLSGDSLEKFVRELEKEACAISCCFIKAAAAAMVHADVHVECPLDDVMRLFSFEVTKKSYAT